MSAQTYETFLRGQAEKAQYGVVIIPARTALDIADFIERMRANGTDIDVGSMISREAAIDCLCNGKCTEEGRWCDDGDCAPIRRIKALPSAEPEIIRCKDCCHCNLGYDDDDNQYYSCTVRFDEDGFWNEVGAEDFCSWAGRRTDGN